MSKVSESIHGITWFVFFYFVMVLYRIITDIRSDTKVRKKELEQNRRERCAEYNVPFTCDLNYCSACDKPLSEREEKGESGGLYNLCESCRKQMK